MKQNKVSRFVVRWVVCAVGLWLAAALVGQESISFSNNFVSVVMAGLILAIINTIIKPFVVFLSLPAVLLSLGIFMVVINGFMVVLASKFYSSLQVSSFGVAIIAGIVIGLVNFFVTAIIEDK
ncbi:phage holin family protein [bacterium]|nr:phage holin family protein [bacterium]NBX98582.1 phage holin family protein [bacterium]NDC94475.1 phage holin family protein [bacterium]NDD84055.1 phage holin family protein [bacterium]NDG29529.1 phage holin family protein [bacterium]